MITNGFFNSVNGDRKYDADSFNTFLQGLISENGIFESVGDKFQVTANDGMIINVGSGKALVGGHWVKSTSTENITLDVSDVTLNRYDAIVLRYSQSDRMVTLEVIKGTNATTPAKPTIRKTETLYEICLAYVYVGAGVSTITQAAISDTRLDTNLCGYITGLVDQVDTSQLFDQWETACNQIVADMEAWKTEVKNEFADWFATLTQDLNVNTYLVEYKSIYNTTEETYIIPINIDEYDPTTDILFVNINGVMFTETADYTISGAGSMAKINLIRPVRPNNTIECRVLKSTISVLRDSGAEGIDVSKFVLEGKS